jgi:hypothetical protein
MLGARGGENRGEARRERGEGGGGVKTAEISKTSKPW